MKTVCFSEKDMLDRASYRKPGYVEAVYAVAVRKDGQLCVTVDEYAALHQQFVLGPLEVRLAIPPLPK